MRAVQRDPVIGLVASLVLLGALDGTVGLGGTGWLVGALSAVAAAAALTRGLARCGVARLGPADWVTLVRAGLVAGVAALSADSFHDPVSVPTLVGLATLALSLDAVDGWVARQTRTVSTLGARFDLEVDAFLILVLSVYVSRSTGSWVLAIGVARYGFVAAGWLLPWLRGSAPPRYWCKVVAAVQGVVLTTAAVGVLPRFWTVFALAVALALLAESFGRETWELWRRSGRSAVTADGEQAAIRLNWHRRLRATAGVLTTVVACLLVWFALVAPHEVTALTPTAFVRLPVEGLLLAVLVIALPSRASRPLVVGLGAVLGFVSIVKVLDMGFFAILDRPFDPLTDWTYFGPALGVLSDSSGRTAAIGAAVAAAVAAVAVLVLTPLSTLRLARLVDRHRARSSRAVATLGAVWVLCAAFNLQLVGGAPLASTSAAQLVFGEVNQVRAGIQDRKAFSKQIADDPYQDAAGDQLLTALRGKDVLVVFVESYGRVAVEGSTFSPRVDAVLDAGTTQLEQAGFSARSAYLESPTFGAASWLAHSSLQSGLWVDSQQRYNQLLASDRLTLSGAFQRAGWRTVFDDPAITKDWPDGSSFYRFDTLYDARNVGYQGPPFSYATMPDQYTLSAFQRRELADPDHAPVMAEIDLISSHHPWTPLPHLVEWDRVGDGSIFDDMPEQGDSPDEVFRDPDRVRARYGQSIEYSLSSLIAFLRTFPDPDLVLVVLGDHQPHSYVSGADPGHDVPISIVAHDPAVLDQISGWRWQDGLRPHTDAPVWPMDAFRDRFLAAYGSKSRPDSSAAAAPRPR